MPTTDTLDGEAATTFRSPPVGNTYLGLSALRLGLPARAAAPLARCREMAAALPLPAASTLEVVELARCFHTSGELAQSTGDTPAARTYFQQALNAWQAGIDRPQSRPYLKTEHAKTAAALAKLP